MTAIRGLMLALLVLAGLAGSPTRAGAQMIQLPPDLQIVQGGFVVAISRNGVVVPIPPGGDPIPFFPTDTLSASFQLAVTIDTLEAEDGIQFDATISIVGLDCAQAPCIESDRFILQTITLGPSDIGTREPPTPGHATFPIQFSGPQFSLFAYFQAAQGHDLRFEVEIDSNDEVNEFIESNNVALAPPIVNLVPAAAVGAVEIGPITLEPDALNLSPNPGGCGGTNPVQIDPVSTATWTPGTGWNAATVTLTPGCANLLPGGGGNLFSLHTSSGTAALVSGTLGGLGVQAVSNSLAPAGAIPQTVHVELPPGHSVHAEDQYGRAVPRGARELVFDSFSSGRVADYGDLVAVAFSERQLQVRGLPFALPFYQVELNSGGLEGELGAPEYAHDHPFHVHDLRHYNQRGVVSNDRRYESGGTPNGGFALTGSGLDADLSFQAGGGHLTYPRSTLAWAEFDLEIAGSEIPQGSTLPAGGLYRFEQSTACESCPPGDEERPVFLLTPDVDQGLAADGSVLAHIAAADENPRWGPWDAGADRFIYERLDDAEQPALWYVPGFRIAGSGGIDPDPAQVVESLMGLRRAQLDGAGVPHPGALAPLLSAQSRRGNGSMAGLNLGPEILRPTSGPPQVGAASSLEGTRTRIGFGGLGSTPPAYREVVASAGTKLNVRNAGVTGTFNTFEPPQPPIYGYNIALERFAFRQATNVPDPHTWIDGEVDLDGPGDFTIAFDGLELECTGDVSKGLVDREENEGQRLGAWQAYLEEIFSMAFVPEDPDTQLCEAGNRVLEVGKTVDIVALDEPLGIIAQWNADGEPQSGDVHGDTERVFDRPEGGDGFDILFGHQIDLEWASDSNGWFRANGAQVPVPIWEALDVDARFQNADIVTPMQTLVGPPGAAFLDELQDGDTLAASMAEAPLTAEYRWGNTGYGIGLPVSLLPGRAPVLPPRFGGHTDGLDMIVLEVTGGIDFIDPDSTRASLGASAELGVQAALGELSSVSGLTGALVNAGVLPAALGDALPTVRGTVEALTDVAGSGFGGFLSDGLRDHLDAGIGAAAGASAPLPTLARALTEVNGLPGRLASQVVGPLEEQIQRLTGSLVPSLEIDAALVRDDLPGQLIDVIGGADPAVLDTAEAALGRLETALEQTRGVYEEQNEIYDEIRETLLDLETTQSVFGSAAAGVAAIDALTASNYGLPDDCGGHPVAARIGEFTDRLLAVRDVLGLAQGTDLVAIAESFAGEVDLNLSEIEDAQRDIQDLVDDITDRLDAVLPILEGLTCGGAVDYAAMGDHELNPQLTQIRNGLDQIDENTNVTLWLEALSNGSILAQLQDSMGDAFGQVTDQLASVQTLQRWIEEARGGAAALDGITTESAIEAYLGERAWDQGGQLFPARLRDEIAEPVQALLGQAAFVGQLGPLFGQNGIINRSHTAESLLSVYVGYMMNDTEIEAADRLVFEHLDELVERLGEIDSLLMDQINTLVRGLASATDGALADLLENSSSPVGSEAWNFLSANLDGFALFEGDDLARLHVEAGFSVFPDSEEDGEENSRFSMSAAADVARWTNNGKDEGCPGVANADSRLDVGIEARNLPFRLGLSRSKIRRIAVGFTLEEQAGGPPLPRGASGGIEIEGRLGAQALSLIDPAFVAGFGDVEGVVGFSGLGIMGETAVDLAFMAGRTCNRDLLRALDPQVDEYIGDLLDTGFAGLFSRASLSTDVWNNGCLLRLGVGVDVGSWVVINDGIHIGGLYGGGLYGMGACLVSIRGQIAMGMTLSITDDVTILFDGDMFVAGGLGLCSPEGWNSVSNSRADDPLCGTVDAQMGAGATVVLPIDLESGTISGDFSLDYELDTPQFGGIH